MKTIRVVAWVMGFICSARNAKSHCKHGELSYEELTQAKHELIIVKFNSLNMEKR